ncbi:SOS response-associated peptidase family protein [Methylocystis sp. H62]|uniref:SOS response-associated peptidase family protein n=1 Tax=Methylocystis sp. H62 TaxID=2785789 RepID=UPI0018C28C09|nr:SOS response-associated peptidase family protein [Methylocystis sp. H62]
MCGRFTLHLSWEELHRLADLIGQPRNLQPRYNIAPTTRIEVIRLAAAGNDLVRCAGGLCRHGGRSRSATFLRHSTLAPTVAEKPMFRSAFKSRRCVIPAPGFGAGLL